LKPLPKHKNTNDYQQPAFFVFDRKKEVKENFLIVSDFVGGFHLKGTSDLSDPERVKYHSVGQYPC
jgi:hypothetical protein